MSGLLDRIKNNPAVLSALILAAVNIAVGVGFVSENMAQDIITVMFSLLILVAGVAVRQSVYSPKTVEKLRGTRRDMRFSEGPE